MNFVHYKLCDGIARLTLDNPARHNALGQAELDSLERILAALDNEPALRVLLLTGRGEKTFCAGAALDQLDGVSFDGDSFARVTQRLADLTVPSVCALNGNVFGAGVDLALACDFRIGLERSRMRVPAAAIGACYPPASVQRMVAQLGVAASRRLLLAAETFDDAAMLACGFLHWRVSRAELEGRVEQLLGELVALAPRSQSVMKQLLNGAQGIAADDDAVAALVRSCFESEDFAEGMAAQRARRQPQFTGK